MTALAEYTPYQVAANSAVRPRIVLRDMTIDYPIYSSQGRSLKKRVLSTATGGQIGRDASDRVIVRGLDGVTLTIEAGERVGLIGHNGAGKTTLLRALCGVYAPSGGIAEITGRATSLIDLSLGIEDEATGYENIRLRGLMMGLTKDQIDELTPSIEEFTELGPYLSVPVRTYSSGMRLRLAFTVSTAVSPEILLMDEWLSVGDAAFREKAESRLKEVVDRSGILVIASHNLGLIEKLCTRAIWLDHGRVQSDGGVQDVVESWQQHYADRTTV
ncbi:MAG: ABC transporter ATP-binding protein [Pseudomonadota bacterium]